MNWSLHVPYGDCDQQRVVFNAKYLAYVDDCVDRWFADELGDRYLGEFDIMLKKATVEWFSPARYRDDLELTPCVDRWGTTSFDVRVEGVVGDRRVFTATIVYVCVDAHAHTPMPMPADIRVLLSASTASPAPA